MATFFNDLYVEEPRDLGFKPCINEFIKEHWNDRNYTIFIEDSCLGKSFVYER